MKKLSLFMFVILILGCETETPVVEEPTPAVASDERIQFSNADSLPDDENPPLIDMKMTRASVRDRDVGVAPELLNQEGILFDFNNPILLFKVDILLYGEPLDWQPRGVIVPKYATDILVIKPVAGSELRFNTEYVIKIYIQDHSCTSWYYRIRFRTKPH